MSMNSLVYPLSTEKALNMIDKNNTISYIVDFRSSKPEIKKEFEDTFAVKVASINTETTMKNTKRAYIKLKPEFKASDVARKLKLV
jgi:large subunit ribosomal protein L23